MTYRQKMRRVVLPQAFRVIIPPTGNEFIAMMKDTALVSFLGVDGREAEIFRRAQLVGKRDFKTLEALRRWPPRIYWALTAIFTFFQAGWSGGSARATSGGGRATKAQIGATCGRRRPWRSRPSSTPRRAVVADPSCRDRGTDR